MKKFVCGICGYVHEGKDAPAVCPVCKAPAAKFSEMTGDLQWADEHKVGAAKGLDKDVVDALRMNYEGECAEAGMYLAMSRQADREGLTDVAEAYKRYAIEEAEHASKFAELLGEVLTSSTKKNLEMRIQAEFGACEGKKKLATRAKELGYDAIHDTVHEMCKDEARHGAGFNGLYSRHFKK